MSRTSSFIFGACVGALVGWVAGELLADVFAPEYYSEEELEELSEVLEDYIPEDGEIKTETKGIEPMGKKRNYQEYFKKAGEEKEPLEQLINKHNDPDYVEPDEEDEDEELDGEEVVDDSYVAYIDNINPEEDIYLMTKEDFETNDTGFTQTTLLYYPEDDVLTDVKDKALRNIEKTLGTDALVSFGLYSDDIDVVYVCNPKLKGEYEVIRQEGSYSEKVLGKPKKKAVVHHNVFDDAKQEGDED